MIEELRKDFNARWSPERYERFLSRLDGRCGTHVTFRVSETPLFLPSTLLRQMEKAGQEIITQLMTSPKYRMVSERSIPRRFRAPNEDAHPLFVAVDFGIARTSDGSFTPRLIELQGFPSLFAYQPVLCELYSTEYNLSSDLTPYPPSIDKRGYEDLFREALLGGKNPENVILLEIDPLQQKTLPDFLLTERLCGIATVNARDVVKQGNRLYYKKSGTLIQIERIYNRMIPEDLEKSGARLSFSLDEDLDVEWAGHPNWFFRLSKFALPYLAHPSVPQTMFLSDLSAVPDEFDRWVLKPLFSFAGSGVIVHPTAADIEIIPAAQRRHYVLQEKVDYAGVVTTPHGITKAEVRILYIWREHPRPVHNLVRLGRGPMMGVDHNKGMAWVGSSAAFWPS